MDCKGPPGEKKSVAPWWVGGPRRPKTRGAEEKKRKKRRTYLPTYLFLRFFEIFRSDFRKYFYGVFGLRMQRNGQKRDKKIDGKRRKETPFFLSTFSAQSF
jgi:hypothetical protein